LQYSGLPLEKSLANFDVKRLPAKVSRQMKVLLEGGFLDRRENLLAFGNPGAGKSHLLCAIAQELISTQGRKIKYTTCALLVQDLLVAKRELQLTGEVRRPHYRSNGVRATKSRGDGSLVHAFGGAL
jgi:DNA replication protein DnaC